MKSIATWLVRALSRYAVEKEDVIGVDITPSNIRLCELDQKNETSWLVNNISTRSYQTSDDEDEEIRNIAKALKAMVEERKIKTRAVAISLPLSGVIIRSISMPIMTDDELAEAVATDTLWDNVANLPGDSSDYAVYWQVLKRHVSTQKMDLLFVGSKKEEVQRQTMIVEEAGLVPVIVDVRCFALRNGFMALKNASDDPSQKDFALVHLSPHESFMLLVQDGTPHTQEFFIPDHIAEVLHTNNKDNELVEAFLESLVLQIGQTFADYGAKFGIFPHKNISLSVDGELQFDFAESLNERMGGYEFSVFNPFANMAVPTYAQEVIDGEPYPGVFGTAVGLATRKLDVFGYYKYTTAVDNVNLIPNREAIKEAKRGDYKRLIILSSIVSLIVIIGMAGWFGMSFLNKDNSAIKAEHAQLQRELNASNQQISSYSKDLQSLAGRLAASKNITGNIVGVFSGLDELFRKVPSEIQLNDIRVDGSMTTITGFANSGGAITTFITALRSASFLDDVRLLSVTRDNELLRDRFLITAQFIAPDDAEGIK